MFTRLVRLLVFLAALAAFVLPAAGVSAQAENAPAALVLTAEGALTPMMSQYLARGLLTAQQQNARLLIFQLNTPGGSIELMSQMVQQIRASRIPVVVYVAPRGAMAGSAGTVITLAGHVAAMAPETAIGAASPVGAQGEDLSQTMQAKSREMLKASIRTLTEGRSPDAISLAEAAVDEARAATAAEALDKGLVDIIAVDIPDLLQQLDGRRVTTIAGAITLQTAGIQAQPLPMTLIEQSLQLATNPNLVFLLLTIGVQAILIELSSPGGWVAGFIGVVCLALAVYGLGILPVNLFGLVFLGTAFVLFILDIKAPTHGLLTAAGAVSFVIGALVLFNSPGVPAFQRVSIPLVVGTGLATAIFFFTIVAYALRAQRVPIATGRESLAGRRGTTRSELNPHGMVQVASELWSAELAPGEPPMPPGTRIVVVAVDGLRLTVRRE